MLLWGKAQPLVAAYVHSVVWNVHDAEDVVQETIGAIVKLFDRFDDKRPFTPWAIGIARNKVREYCRARARDPLVFFAGGRRHVDHTLFRTPCRAESRAWLHVR